MKKELLFINEYYRITDEEFLLMMIYAVDTEFLV